MMSSKQTSKGSDEVSSCCQASSPSLTTVSECAPSASRIRWIKSREMRSSFRDQDFHARPRLPETSEKRQKNAAGRVPGAFAERRRRPACCEGRSPSGSGVSPLTSGRLLSGRAPVLCRRGAGLPVRQAHAAVIQPGQPRELSGFAGGFWRTSAVPYEPGTQNSCWKAAASARRRGCRCLNLTGGRDQTGHLEQLKKEADLSGLAPGA